MPARAAPVLRVVALLREQQVLVPVPAPRRAVAARAERLVSTRAERLVSLDSRRPVAAVLLERVEK